eukprot:UN32946
MAGLQLMNKAAVEVMKEYSDCILAYGESDEYSFVFKRDTSIFGRRRFKIETGVVSTFTSAFVYYWDEFFNNPYDKNPKKQKLLYPPSFDGRIVLYPTDKNLKDYLRWRQADCHINNLYNTCFWNLVLKKGKTEKQATAMLQGTDSGYKNELLFSQFDINYKKINPMFRKGTTITYIHEELENEGKFLIFTKDGLQKNGIKKHTEDYLLSGTKLSKVTSDPAENQETPHQQRLMGNRAILLKEKTIT